ncbi:MAG: cytochrome c maturation protein CcmE [bacterium]|nr:cytochrome c maturation protein CcmE [bacterium]
MKAKYIIGGVVIALFTVWGASAFFQTTIQYVSIDKARNSNQMVQVMGKIDFDNVNYNADDSRLEFAIFDAEAESKVGATTMNVVYYGVVPGNFDQATSVVLKGQPEGDVFVADQMLVKCPSKYQGEGGDEYQDMKKHDEAVESGGA